jgi:excisionase family DNA binding protein
MEDTQMDEPKRLLIRPLEAAAMLSVSRSKIYELLAKNLIPSVRVGGLIRVPRAALERLAANATEPEGQ